MALRGTFGFIKKPTVFKKWHDKFSEVKDKVKNYEMPERFKGTFVERWGEFLNIVVVRLCLRERDCIFFYEFHWWKWNSVGITKFVM